MATIDEIVFILTGDTKGLESAFKRAGQTVNLNVKNMVVNISKVDKSVKNLGLSFGNLKGIIATLGIARLGRAMINAASDIQQLNTRLLTTTGSIEAAAEAMGFLRETANRQSVDLIALTNGFNKLLPSVKAGSISMDDLKTILTLTNDNIKALGISTEDTSRIFFGLSQVFGSGIVTMENLKQVTEVLPGSLIKISEEMGRLGKTTNGTLGELIDLVSTGKLASNDLKEALISAFRANEGAAEKMADTFESAMVRLRNATREAFAEAARESGFLQAITDNINSLSDALNEPEFREGLTLLANTFSVLIKAAELGIIALGNFKEGAEVLGESLTTAGVQVLNFLGIIDDDFKNAVTAEFSDRMFGVAKAAEKVKEEVNKATPALDKLGKKVDEVKDKITQQSLSLAGLVKNLEFEIKISKLGDRERAIEIAKRKAIKAVMKETKKEQSEVIKLYQKEIKAIEKLTGTLFDLEKAEKDATEEMKELAKQSDIAAENIQEGLADAISDIVSNLDDLEGVGKRVFNNILKFGIDAFSQIAAKEILGSISGGGGGGVGNIFSSITGGGGGIGTLGLTSAVAAISTTLSSLTAEALGGTKGAQIGSQFGVGGALIGSLFGPGKGVEASEFDSEFGGATTFGSKGASKDFAKNLFTQLSAFTSQIQEAAGATFGGQVRGGFNSRGGGGFLTVGDTRLNFDPENAEEAQQAFNDLAEILLNTADIANEEVAEALKNLQLDGLSAAEAIRAVGIASGLLADQLNQQLEQEILKLTDARAFEIQQIEKQTEALKQEALAIGANVKLVEELGQLRLDQLKEDDPVMQLDDQLDVQKDITRALENSRKEAQKLSDQFAKIATNLKQTALDLQLGNLSALSPEQQLSVSRQAFTDISRRAALGDVAAGQELPKAASAFLEESRNFNASNAAFKSDFASVQTGLLGASDVFSRQSSNQAGVVDAINNSINANSSGLNAIVTQLINLTQQGSTQTQTLRDLTIKMSA